MRAPLVAAATLIGVLAGCNAVTGAGEPEIVDDGAGGSASSTTGAGSLSATTDTTTAGSGGATAGGGGAGDVDGRGGGAPGGCGDGVTDEDELCDDGNLVPGDGCDATCRLECGELEVPRPSAGSCLSVAAENDDRTWDDARDACRDRSGDLVVLADLDVSAFDGRLEGRVHVGARRTDGSFAWLDGAPIEAGEVAEPAAGDCVALDLASAQGPSLVAVPCTTRLRYLCERLPTGG